MRERIGHILAGMLAVLAAPLALTLLLNGRMTEIYRAIKSETEYILVKTGEGTLELSLEEYLIGAVAAQIPLEYDLEAVKAQMVAQRTNLYRQLLEGGGITEGDYLTMEELRRAGVQEKFLRAQSATQGEILTWEDKPILASFHALSAGRTRDGEEVFASEDVPYLVSKVCPSDPDAPQALTEVKIDDSWKGMKISKRDSAGYVLEVELNGAVTSGEKFSRDWGLPSANFEVTTREDGICLEVHGAGHGLGMSQYTAQKMARAGKDYREILGYFYPGTSLEKI